MRSEQSVILGVSRSIRAKCQFGDDGQGGRMKIRFNSECAHQPVEKRREYWRSWIRARALIRSRRNRKMCYEAFRVNFGGGIDWNEKRSEVIYFCMRLVSYCSFNFIVQCANSTRSCVALNDFEFHQSCDHEVHQVDRDEYDSVYFARPEVGSDQHEHGHQKTDSDRCIQQTNHSVIFQLYQQSIIKCQLCIRLCAIFRF